MTQRSTLAPEDPVQVFEPFLGRINLFYATQRLRCHNQRYVPLFVRGQRRVGILIVSGLDGWEGHALAVGGLESGWANSSITDTVFRQAVRLQLISAASQSFAGEVADKA